MKRTSPPLRLPGSPLVLVLCQVRIATVRDMAGYIPALQDRLRRDGFPGVLGGDYAALFSRASGGGARSRPGV